MFLRGIFSSVNNMKAEEVRKYIAEHPADSYTLLDVRTPKEYAENHLQGAQHIPISELADRIGEVDRNKPVITY